MILFSIKILPFTNTCDYLFFFSFPSTATNEYASGYWTGNSTKIKPHNKRYSKVNVPIQAPTHEPVALDAAKRKQLPAWIREGNEIRILNAAG